jgi:hypothetical protein
LERNARKRREYALNPKPQIAASSAYYHQHRDEISARRKTPAARKRHNELRRKDILRNPEKHKAYRRKYAARDRAKLAEAVRLKNVEGLDLKTGLRASLAAHMTLIGKKPYQMASDIHPDSSNPFDATKKLFRRQPVVIADEKQRIAKLASDERQREAINLGERLHHELAKPQKKSLGDTAVP